MQNKNTTIEATTEQKLEMFNILNDVQVGLLNEEKMTKLKTWFIQGDALYKVCKNELGTFGLKTTDLEIAGLPNKFSKEVLFKFVLPKIPQTLYMQVIAFFKQVMKVHNNAEAFAQFFYDKEEEKYLVHIPEQEVSGARVSYQNKSNEYLTNSGRYVFVFECHSHNSMGAFWSSTDDGDEKELRFYGVFGKLDKRSYQEKFRMILDETAIELEASDIFDLQDTTAEVPEDWIKNVNTKKYPKQIPSTLYPTLGMRRSESRGPSMRQEVIDSFNSDDPQIGMFDAVDHESARQWDGEIPIEMRTEAEEGLELGTIFDEMVQEMIDETNHFTDAPQTMEFFRTLEGYGVLHELKSSLENYLGEGHGFLL